MLGSIVEYLHRVHVPFHLTSHPGDAGTMAAARQPQGGRELVDTRLLVVDGRAVLAVFPANETVDLAAASSALGSVAMPGSSDELPGEFRHVQGHIPPLGQLFGIPVVLDDRLARVSVLIFRAFTEGDYFEIAYDDYARLELPRLASFASVGELGAATAP